MALDLAPELAPLADRLRPHLSAEFPELRAALLTGSVVRGTATETSDIDVVLLLPDGSGGLRETVEWDGQTVDLFGYDLAALRHWLTEDTLRRRPALCSIVLDGVPVVGDSRVVEEARSTAREVYDAGPRACEPAELLRMRYGVTDVLLDVATSTDRAETLLLAGTLVTDAVDLLFATARRWSGSGKWLLRELRIREPGLAERLVEGYDTLARTNEPGALVNAVDELLDRCGGRFLVGRSERS